MNVKANGFNRDKIGAWESLEFESHSAGRLNRPLH